MATTMSTITGSNIPGYAPIEPLRLMAILAHPDDESLAVGAALAKVAAAGVETSVLCATRGERGWFGDPAAYPGPAVLGALRTQELAAAAQVLGVQEINYLGYVDGELDQADPAEAVRRIVAHVRRVRPQVVITFDPWGAYGHPDHIAISQFTSAALLVAASPQAPDLGAPHQVAKLYYHAETEAKLAAYQRIFGDLAMHIDGVERRASAWQTWALTTVIDTAAYWQQAWLAISQHRSQLPGYGALQTLPPAQQRELLSEQTFYRAFSLVNGGRSIEHDLFEGIQPAHYMLQPANDQPETYPFTSQQNGI
jgi:LmbE family N-acetylglucosaminyl deacetylase